MAADPRDQLPPSAAEIPARAGAGVDPKRIESAFAEAIDLPTLARGAYLAKLRASDESLADEVESLLRYHEQSPRDATDDGGREGLPPPHPLLGERIGGCSIDRLIGSGGMSAVYAATQDFPRRRVAVKIVRRERTSASAARRLRVEAEALARLEHPNIARVYAAGTCRLPVAQRADDESGAPYIVLELVEGAVPVNRWADDRNLTPSQRIELVAQVAEALAHAHRAGVIHRDLKPGNVIVGEDGVPKVIDFGIAAVADSSVTAATEGPMGTLAYMSPEQARGGSVDTRSDVWGLGALLFDLLAGIPPFDTREVPLARHVSRLLEEAPEPVTRAAVPRRTPAFLQAIPSGTDAVVAKALATDAERRYRTASEFADELRRLVLGEPLLARPDSEWDGIVRLCHRHRASLIAASGIAVAVVAALVVSLSLLRSERAANDRANWAAYLASIAAASGMIERGDASAAKAMLERAPAELRGWEWNHLGARADQSIWSVEIGDRHQVYDVDFTSDGSRIYAAASTYAVAIDASTRRIAWKELLGGIGPMWRTRALPDGGAIFVRMSNRIERTDAAGRSIVHAMDGDVADIALDASRTRLFTNSIGGFVERDLATLAIVRKVDAVPPLGGYPRAVALMLDTSLVAIGDSAGRVTALDEKTGAVAWQWTFPGPAAEVRGLATSADGRRVAVAGGPHVAVLDARTGAVVWHKTISGRHFRSPNFSPDGRELRTATWAETVERFDASDGTRIGAASGVYSQVWTTAAAPDGRTFAAGGLSATVEIFPADASMEPKKVALDGSRVECGVDALAVDVTPDGTCVVGGPTGVSWLAEDGTVAASVATPLRVDRLTALDDLHVFALCSPDTAGDRALLMRRESSRHAAALWHLPQRGLGCGAAARTATPHVYYIPQGQGGETLSLRIASPDGTLLDQPVVEEVLWQPELPIVAALSPDRRTLAIGAVYSEGEVTLSDPRDFRQRRNMPNHRGNVRALAWSPDGTRIASWASDDTVRIWHVGRGDDAGEEILVAWRGTASDLAWTDDGTIWIASSDGSVHLLTSR